MRRIGREHQPVAAQILHRPLEQTVFEWLAPDINALIENVGWFAFLPRHKMRQFFEVLVHTREPPGHLRCAGFKTDNFQIRDAFP